MPSMGTHLGHTLPLSLDDLTRPSQERPRNRQAERLGIVGGVPSDDDSREQRIPFVKVPRAPNAPRGGRPSAGPRHPARFSSGLLEIPADEWDLLAQRPQLPAP